MSSNSVSGIVIATLNARFIHASVGLRYLHVNLAELRDRCVLLEFEVSENAHEIAEEILEKRPRIVGFGVYIWNTVRTREVIAILRKVAPDIVIVLGGPEVSYEYNTQAIVALADFVVVGEGEGAFRELCRKLLAAEPPADKIIHGGLPKLDELELPYSLYTDSDIANRVIYVEVSRGCPFTCEFCLSSIDIPVRQFDHERVLGEIDILFQRGARTFKFVDRTFNLNVRTSVSILRFFLDRMQPGVFVHFEMVPDRFPKQLREIVAEFPPGSLQFEVGIQTFNPDVSVNISRRQDLDKIAENLTWLRQNTGVYVHADLIAGLPGENLESFGAGFDRLVALDPQEIQVGILKRLRGTPIVRHDTEFEMKYNDEPPYEILSNRHLPFETLQRLSRLARYWDLVANSGNFPNAKLLIWNDGSSPFESFMRFSDWLYATIRQRAGINLKKLAALIFQYTTRVLGQNPDEVGPIIAGDYCRAGRSDLPAELRLYKVSTEWAEGVTSLSQVRLKRQRRAVLPK